MDRSSSTAVPTTNIQLSSDPLYERMMAALTKGQDSAIKLRNRLLDGSVGDDGDGFGGKDHESNKDLANTILSSFADGLSLLEFSVRSVNDDTNGVINDNDGLKSGEQSFVRRVNNSSFEDRRRHYNGRKTRESFERITSKLAEDGYTWRKYGQKPIIGSIYPRSYYRCTFKVQLQCPATKHVQKISDSPESYKTTYFGHHTCQNPLTTARHHQQQQQLLLQDDEEADLKNILSFQTASYHPAAVVSYNNEQPLMPPQEYYSMSPMLTMLTTAHNQNQNLNNQNMWYNYSSPSFDHNYVSSMAGSNENGEVISGLHSLFSPSFTSVDDDVNNHMMIGHDDEIIAMLNH